MTLRTLLLASIAMVMLAGTTISAQAQDHPHRHHRHHHHHRHHR